MQDVNNNLENALSSKSKKPIKFVHLQNVTNQSMFDYAVVIEMIETSTAFFIQTRKILRCALKREMFSLKNKTEDDEILHFVKFQWISLNIKAHQTSQKTAKLFMANLYKIDFVKKICS